MPCETPIISALVVYCKVVWCLVVHFADDQENSKHVKSPHARMHACTEGCMHRGMAGWWLAGCMLHSEAPTALTTGVMSPYRASVSVKL